MLDWNVVVTTHEHRYRQARAFLAPLGELHDSGFYNVLVMRVEQPQDFLVRLERHVEAFPEAAASLARVLPVTETFRYQTPEEFELKATAAVRAWLGKLAGSRFHVRMHRRGFKGKLSSLEEEHFLDHLVIEALSRQGKEAVVDFDDPDWILAIDTVAQRAGLSLWSRDALRRYPLLKLD